MGVCERRPALLVPGFTGSKEDFLPVLQPLAAAGRRVFAIDMRGQYESPGPPDPDGVRARRAGRRHRGRSRTPSHRPTAWACTCSATLSAASSRGRRRWPGRPGSTRSPCSAPGRARHREPGRDAARHAGLAGRGGGRFAGPASRRMSGRSGTAPGAAGPGRRRARADHRIPAHAHDEQQSHRPGRHGPVPPRVPGPHRRARRRLDGPPILVLYGENDDAWRPDVQERMARQLRAQRVCIPGAAHSPAVEAPETTASTLTGVLGCE